MCFKRTCCGSAGVCDQHRSLYFHKVTRIQEFADLADDFGALNESLFYLRIHDQVHITLTITQVGIGQTVEFFRKHLKTFA